MEKEKQDAKSAFIARFADYAIGLTLLAKGWEEAEHIGHFPFRVVFILLAFIGLIYFSMSLAQLASRLYDRLHRQG